MAAQNYFSNYSPSLDGIINSAIQGKGVRGHNFQSTVSVLAADDNASTYLILKDVPAEAILSKLEIETDAITGGTDYDIGLYDGETGVVIDKDCYLDGQTMATASTKVAPLDGIGALAHANSLKPVYEVAGHTLETKKKRYDLVLTANTVGTAAGSITFRGMLMPGG